MTTVAPDPPPATAPDRTHAVLDLRGERLAGTTAHGVLEDATGGRRRVMRNLGLAVAGLLTVWLLALLLSGLGLFPRGSVPLSGTLGVQPPAAKPAAAAPGPDRSIAPLSAPATRPTVQRPRAPQRVTRATVRRDAPTETTRLAPGRARVPGRSTAPVRPTARGRGTATAPGQTVTPGSSGSAPGHSGQGPAGVGRGTVTAPSRSGAPGQTGTAPGKAGATRGASGTAPRSTTAAGRSKAGAQPLAPSTS
jgi:hypothetical protein